MLRELKGEIDLLWKELDELLNSLSSMDLERKLRELIDMLVKSKSTTGEITDHIKRMILLTDSYDGYTTGAEDGKFYSGINVRSKKMLDELKASNAAMTKRQAEIEKIIEIFRAEKKTGDVNKDNAVAEKRKGDVAKIETLVLKEIGD